MEKEVDGKIESTDQKHIMRYQQMFAALAIRQQLSEGATSGVVWHTQGSGKRLCPFISPMFYPTIMPRRIWLQNSIS